MRPGQSINPPKLRQPGIKTATLIVVVSLLLVLYATLSPFNFSFENSSSFEAIIGKFSANSTHLTDQINNILLFIPFGFGLACLVNRSNLKLLIKLFIVLLFSAFLSFTVEVLQSFLPSRTPTPEDIVNNTLSGFLGFVCFYFWKYKLLERVFSFVNKNRSRSSFKQSIVIFIGYIALAFLVVIPWQNTTNFSNWNLTSSLLLGNEKTGDRPWQGYISEVYIADRAISQQEVAQVFANEGLSETFNNSLIAAYPLTGENNYRDRTGNSPNLSWQGQPPKRQVGTGVFVNSNHWLATTVPATLINQRLRETGEFTIVTTANTANTQQIGPARIISLSSNTAERNFTLGQYQQNLVFRLRTPLNGTNAAHISQIVPNVFANTAQHRVVITYANSVLKIYVDNLQNLHSFNLLESLPKSEKLLYYGLMFIPFGFLLALITTLSKPQLSLYLAIGGILLPALIVEVMLASISDRGINPTNLLLAILITTTTFVLCKLQISDGLKKHPAT